MIAEYMKIMEKDIIIVKEIQNTVLVGSPDA